MPRGGLDRANLLLIASGYAGGLAAFPWLPGPYLGPERSLAVRAAIAFLIPTAALVTSATVETLFKRSTSNAPHVESAKAIRAVSAWTVLFMVGLHGLVLVGLLGLPISGFPVHRMAVALFGLWLIGIGNVLPRVRPNIVIGIRTRPLLDDPLAWARMHRMAGYFLVTLGAIAVGAGLTLSKSQIPLVFSSAAVFAAAVNLAAYQTWTRGDATAARFSRGDALLWTLRILLAAIFLFEGIDKFSDRRLWVRIFEEIGFGQWFRYFTGVVEVSGALLLLIPKATLVAAGLLICTMIGALLVQVLLIGVGPQTGVVVILLLTLGAIVYQNLARTSHHRSSL